LPRSFRVRVIASVSLAGLAALVALLFGESLGVVLLVAALLIAAAVLAFASAAAVAGEARMLAGAAREIAQGEFSARLAGGADDEMGAAYDEFNRMAARLEARVADASQERNRLMAAINSSLDAVVAVDVESNVTFANDAVRGLLDRPPEDIVGHPFVWIMPDPAAIEGLRASRERRESTSLVIERPNRRYLRAIITPIVGGGAWSSLVVFHDMTDVKRVEEMRRDFVGNVSHELRTPLAAIKSVIETLEGGALEDEKVARDFLQRADGEVERLVQMVEELLELSRLESGELSMTHETVDIAAVVETAADRMRPPAERAGLVLDRQVAPDVPKVTGDRVSLERAVVNLVHNAIKFTPEGGRIDIIARPERGGVTIEVADTGVGIEPADLPRVFERFFKADRARRAGGTGLGLSLVKHTAEAHGGSVQAESRLGEGSRFRIWLPAAA
jgi:two-component system phosphate regulon sensor histidine kinase PhoR